MKPPLKPIEKWDQGLDIVRKHYANVEHCGASVSKVAVRRSTCRSVVAR